jgi:SAM-dependent methyltransferase
MPDHSETRASRSHLAHENHMKNLAHEKDQRLFVLRNKDCYAYWIHTETLHLFRPFLEKQNTWLTIGDYNGFEAQYFRERGQRVVASDISDTFLKEAKEEGLIEEYRKENVERIDLAEDSFDYVSCREAFHHFPRAYLGLYEMIRVAKTAAIIVEPVDPMVAMPVMIWLKNICDRLNPFLINKIWKNRFSWETVGNYVFKISEREVEKIAMGIGLPCIAFRKCNVVHSNLVEKDQFEIPLNQAKKSKAISRTRKRDFLCWLGLIPYNTLCAVVFKEMPDEKLQKAMKDIGYKVLPLPPNPYLK